MSNDNTRVYFYEGEWHEYEYLHDSHGITLSPATPISVYDNSLNEYPAWVDTSNNYIWVVRDSQWYSPDSLPYWIKLDTKFKVYLIGRLLPLDIYTQQSSEMYGYSNELVTFNYIHNNFGITRTPSVVYFIQSGVIKSWYNEDINQYWDVDTSAWYDHPAEYSPDEPPVTPGTGDATNINDVGAIGMFLYTGNVDTTIAYGSVVSGSLLQQVEVTMPNSGQVSYTKISGVLTGSWRILNTIKNASESEPSIILARKVSNSSSYTDNDTTDTNEDTSSTSNVSTLNDTAAINNSLSNTHNNTINNNQSQRTGARPIPTVSYDL